MEDRTSSGWVAGVSSQKQKKSSGRSKRISQYRQVNFDDVEAEMLKEQNEIEQKEKNDKEKKETEASNVGKQPNEQTKTEFEPLASPASVVCFATTKIQKDYKIGKILGRGAFSVVFKAKHKETGHMVAIKSFKKSRLMVNGDSAIREAQNLLKLQHPNIVQVYEVREDKTHYFLIMELVNGPELFDKIINKGFYTEEEARNTMKQVFQAVRYLHQHGIAHRDLKPENLICEGEGNLEVIKIVDFGMSIQFNRRDQLTRSLVGSPGYAAPEVLIGEPYDTKVDMWSLGIILYIILAGFPPFDGRGPPDKIINCEYSFNYPEWDNVSQAAIDLIQKLLIRSADLRLNAAEVLKHPWMTGNAKIGNSNLELQMPQLKDYQNAAKSQRRSQIQEFTDTIQTQTSSENCEIVQHFDPKFSEVPSHITESFRKTRQVKEDIAKYQHDRDEDQYQTSCLPLMNVKLLFCK